MMGVSKEKLPRKIREKSHILKYISIILIFLSAILFTYHFLFYFPSNQIKEINLDEIAFSTPPESNVQTETPPTILSENFEELENIENLAIEQQDLTKYLTYGFTIIESQEQTYKTLIDSIEKTDIPYLLSSQAIRRFVNYSFDNAKEETIENFHLNDKLRNIVADIIWQLRILKLSSNNEKDKQIDELISILSKNDEGLDSNYVKLSEYLSKSITENDISVISQVINKSFNLDNLEEINKINSILDIPQIFVKESITETSFSEEIPNEYYNNYLENNEHLEMSNFEEKDKTTLQNIIAEPDYGYIYYMKDILTYMDTEFEKAHLNTTTIKNLKSDLNTLCDILEKQESNIELETEDINFLNKIITFSIQTTPEDPLFKPAILVSSFTINEISTIAAGVIYFNSEYQINISNDNFGQEYDVNPTSQSLYTVRIPILMYHRLEPIPTSGSKFLKGLYITPEIFEQQIAYLAKKNYKTLNSQEFYDLISSGVNPTQKSVMLTFDDGVASHYTVAYQILKKYGLTGVFYIPSARTSISYSQLKEMSDNGMDIQSHSATHIDLEKENEQLKLSSEICGSKSALQSATGKPVIAIAYPGCVADTEAFNTVAGCGYKLGLSCGRNIDHGIYQRLSLARLHVNNDLESFIDMLSGIN